MQAGLRACVEKFYHYNPRIRRTKGINDQIVTISRDNMYWENPNQIDTNPEGFTQMVFGQRTYEIDVMTNTQIENGIMNGLSQDRIDEIKQMLYNIFNTWTNWYITQHTIRYLIQYIIRHQTSIGEETTQRFYTNANNYMNREWRRENPEQ